MVATEAARSLRFQTEFSSIGQESTLDQPSALKKD
jgi:hypothetical protein